MKKETINIGLVTAGLIIVVAIGLVFISQVIKQSIVWM